MKDLHCAEPRTIEEIRNSALNLKNDIPNAFDRMRSELDGALARIALFEQNQMQLQDMVLANKSIQAANEKKLAEDAKKRTEDRLMVDTALETIFQAIEDLENISLQVRVYGYLSVKVYSLLIQVSPGQYCDRNPKAIRRRPPFRPTCVHDFVS